MWSRALVVCLPITLMVGCVDRLPIETDSGRDSSDTNDTNDTNDSTDTNDTNDSTDSNDTNDSTDSNDSADTFDDGPPPSTGDGPEIPDTCDDLELAVTSECIVGDTILSTEHADELCEAELGEGWSWLEFHATAGWSVQAQINMGAWNTESRAWVWIDDQDAECFSSPLREVTEGRPARFGMTWMPLEANEGCTAANCNAPMGLDEPGLDPIVNEDNGQMQCNPYEGDTPCSRCRPLLCVRSI